MSSEALESIDSVLRDDDSRLPQGSSPVENLFICCERIAKFFQREFKRPHQKLDHLNLFHQINAISRINRLRYRRITLTGDWKRRDSGPLLVFYENFQQSALLIPLGSGHYQLIVPSKNIHRSVRKSDYDKFLPYGFMFYQSLPEKKLGWRDLLKFSFQNRGFDLRRIFIFQGIVSLLGLFIPIATGLIVDSVIPSADYHMLWQFSAALILNIFVIAFFNIVVVFSTVRIRLKITSELQPAIWDRILGLPLYFFRKYTAGDLANRIKGITTVQAELTTAFFIILVSSTLSIFTLGLMLYYDPWITLITLALVIIIAIVTTSFSLVQLRHLRRIYALQGKVTGQVLQFIVNISKLKIANSISRAFERWADTFSQKTKSEYRSGQIGVYLTIFSTFSGVIVTMILFASVVARGDALSFGSFITFNAAYAQFFAAIFSLIGVIVTLLELIPVYERIKPIIQTEPELETTGIPPGSLTGKIDLTHIAFRYDEESPIVLKDISFSVKPGEFVALVGPSGCGKSSIFRLLLRFEKPQSGKIYYSDRELNTLDISLVRKQMGVVLQDTLLFPGSIRENIVGVDVDLHDEAVYEVLRKVQLYDEVVAMPMRLNTLMTEFGKTLSAGQRQRLLLARALIWNPKILLLDEATSAIDNHTQKAIQEHLSSLKVTRIVAAHRLASIKTADKIYVIDNGQIEQSGTFTELISKEGLFRELAVRQQL